MNLMDKGYLIMGEDLFDVIVDLVYNLYLCL